MHISKPVILAGLVGVSLGLSAGYLLADMRLRAMYERDAEEEIQAVRDVYRTLKANLDSSKNDQEVSELVPEQDEDEMVIQGGRLIHANLSETYEEIMVEDNDEYVIQDGVIQLQFPSGCKLSEEQKQWFQEAFELDGAREEDYDFYIDIAMDRKIYPETYHPRRAMIEGCLKDSGVLETVEERKERMDAERDTLEPSKREVSDNLCELDRVEEDQPEPYFINDDIFWYNEKHYSQLTMTYFLEDEVLIDDGSNMLDPRECGLYDILQRIPTKNYPDVVYIRHNAHEQEIELVIDPMSFHDFLWG